MLCMLPALCHKGALMRMTVTCSKYRHVTLSLHYAFDADTADVMSVSVAAYMADHASLNNFLRTQAAAD